MAISINVGITARQRGGPSGGTDWPTNGIYNYSENLAVDPPLFSFTSMRPGTWTWDFHSSATPPTLGAGDIATGSAAIVLGANTGLTIDLSAYPGQTGYIHHRVTDATPEVSNTRTSGVLTTAAAGLVVDEGASTGTFSTSGLYRIWTGPGNLVVTAEGDAAVLLAGGGGGGGGRIGGGGGAGEYLYYATRTLTVATHTAVVGAGGAGGSEATNGVSGGDTTFSGLTARGGGRGGTVGGTTSGANGGSGGASAGSGGTAGTSTAIAPGLGNAAGGRFSTTEPGGGGGSAGAGVAAASGVSGNGGPGTATPVPGESGGYCAGGGGGLGTGVKGVGGTFGGGDGQDVSAATAGATGRGCGGGGGKTNAPRTGAAGSDGAVKVWWLI